MDFLKHVGNPIKERTEPLSVVPLLMALDALKAANVVFPWSKTASSHWVYYALVNAPNTGWDKRALSMGAWEKRWALQKTIESLESRGGGGRGKLMFENPKTRGARISRLFTEVVSLHRIDSLSAPDLALFRRIKRTFDSGKDLLAKGFKSRWEAQSVELRQRLAGSKTLGRWLYEESVAEENRRDIDRIIITLGKLKIERFENMRRIVAAYCVIRGLYGISLGERGRSENIRPLARLGQRLVRNILDRPTLSEHNDVLEALEEAKRKGMPSRQGEARELRALKQSPVFRQFRLGRFMRHCRRIEKAI